MTMSVSATDCGYLEEGEVLGFRSKGKLISNEEMEKN